MVAAAAQWPVGVERLVAHLAGRAIVTLVHPAINGDHATDAGAKGDADHRRCAPAGAEAQLGEAEGARVVDQVDRQAERLADFCGDRLTGPIAGQVDQQADRARRRVVQPGYADADR